MAHNKLACISCIILGLLSPTGRLLADNNGFNPFVLPPDKSVLKLCKQSALAAVPGQTVNFQIKNTAAGFIYQFEIHSKDQNLYLVTCEGASRKIIHTQLLK